ncbi:hypothetical protein [Oscillatoria sp. FACHB-1407]|nr:hypothetical protein [Oscillatoria sp. FACHB-1407]
MREAINRVFTVHSSSLLPIPHSLFPIPSTYAELDLKRVKFIEA